MATMHPLSCGGTGSLELTKPTGSTGQSGPQRRRKKPTKLSKTACKMVYTKLTDTLQLYRMEIRRNCSKTCKCGIIVKILVKLHIH